MAINLGDNIKIQVPKPVDAKYLNNTEPYVDVAAVNTAIPSGLRSQGLTVNIAGVEYWYGDGILDGDLVVKTSDGGVVSAANGLSVISGTTVILGGTLTSGVTITGTYPVEFVGIDSFLVDNTGGTGTIRFNDTEGYGIIFDQIGGGGLCFIDTGGGGTEFIDTGGGGLRFCDCNYGGVSFKDLCGGGWTVCDIVGGGGINFCTNGDMTSKIYANGTTNLQYTLNLASTDATFTDSRTTKKGILYSANYTGLTNCSLVHKQYVDTAITNNAFSLTSGSGTAANGTAVDLGGTLNGATTISGSYLLTLGDLNGICLTTLNTNDIALNSKSNGAIYLKAQSGTTASSNDMTGGVGIGLDFNASVPMLVTDNTTNPSGLQYDGDYSLNYTSRSLVDKEYVDTVATGLNVHEAVVVATTGNNDLNGLTTIDGITISAGNRVLVKDQTDGTENGIYSASTGTWGRTVDYDFSPSSEISNGDLIPVNTGTTNGNSQWILTSPDPVDSGDTLTFSLFSVQQGIVEGNGICVTTSGTNKEVAVKLSPSDSGLCFDTNALELDYTTFRYGLTCANTTGYVDVRACVASPTGTEVCVKINTGGTNTLYTDSSEIYSAISSCISATTAGIGICDNSGTFDLRVTNCLANANQVPLLIDTSGSNILYTDSQDIVANIVSSTGTSVGSEISVRPNNLNGATLVIDSSDIQTAIGGITGATQGLTKSGSDVKLGGTISEGITLTLTGASQFTITDSRSSICGIQYGDDYSTGFTNNSLVSKLYVDTAVNNNINSNNIYPIDTSGGTYTLSTGSSFVQLISGGSNVTLPSTPLTGQAFKLKDYSGTALSNNITIISNTRDIDGSDCAIINTDYGALEIVYNGTTWFALSFVN